MRIFLVLLVMIIYFVLTLPVYLILLLIGLKYPHFKVKVSQKMVCLAFRVIFVCSATKLDVYGVENIPRDQAVLYASNHRGYADVPAGYLSVPGLTGFVAKKEIARIPLMSWWMRNINCLFLDRVDVKKGLATILRGVELIKQGYSMFIMPEGTRNKGEGLLPFKEGSFKMAEKSGAPIVPVAISNADAVFEKQFPWIKPAHVIIQYGEPIFLTSLPKEEKKMIGNRVRSVISEMLKQDEKLI